MSAKVSLCLHPKVLNMIKSIKFVRTKDINTQYYKILLGTEHHKLLDIVNLLAHRVQQC